ncbi:MAG: MBL fold metallo-hydrolase [Paludibacteraceae bacterium]|nr:MBL fold metallo-hydrolase [Paludibacteraceae bacterium]
MEKIEIKCAVCNPYMQNTYIVHKQGEDRCVIVDAGMYTAEEERQVSEYIRSRQLQVDAILITHAHTDHICGKQWLKETYPSACLIDQTYLSTTYREHEPLLQIAGMHIRCLYTPGHKEDCVCYYMAEAGVLFAGDTLFRESVGRTDLSGGDYATLQQSLQYLMQLPAGTTVYSGHGEPTTIAHERQYNPFVGRFRSTIGNN